MLLHRRTIHFMAGALVMVLTGVAISASPREDAQRILEAAGVEGGLVVHVGCGDGRLTAALGDGDGFLVQGLDADPANVRKARAHIRSEGLYGRVSVDRLAGDRLPYIDDLANLVVVSDRSNVPMEEVMRVLAPHGVAYVKEGDAWKKRIKPRPDALDVWTHYLYDATNNAVAHDTVVGPPRRTQWTGGPRWARHHDHMASMSAMVATDRRVFTIMDEGSVASIRLPANWYLSARDAFNGTLLWKRAIPDWWPHLYPLKSGPGLLPRRLVAVGDEVYVTLGVAAPLSALDAATGKTLRTYEGTKGTEEVLHGDGLLFVVCNPALPNGLTDFAQSNSHCWTAQRQRSNQFGWHGEKKQVMGIEPDSGKALWKHTEPVAPLTLASDGKRVYYMRQDRIVARDPKSGKELWASDTVPVRKVIGTGFGPTLVIHKGVVLFYGGQKHTLVGLDAETGKKLWEGKLPPSGHFCPEDVLCINGLAWAADIAGARGSGTFIGRDVRSGEVTREVPQDVNNNLFVMHQRCYRSKATVNWLIPPRIGTEFVDFRKKHWDLNHWVRGGCVYGIVPCNGLVYATPHSCACYMQSKLSGFYALAPDAKKKRAEPSDEERLEKGPAYGSAISNLKSETSKADWPTYRHDALRSGHTASAVPADLHRAWQADLGGRLSAVTVAGGRLYVASVETHTVHALDARTGKPAWSYTAGGRVDSPPTLWNGRALFGSADGHVYCLRASDGELLWRFRAAPHADRMVAYDQVESVWPMHGSVLVQDGVVYAVAGRCMFLDGGMRLLRLDAKTGRKISETILDDRVPGTGEDLYTKMRHKQLPVALPDILSSDGSHVYMRAQQFTLDGRRTRLEQGKANDQGGEGMHLFSPIGFLDGSWWHRSYWVWAKNFDEGWGEWYRNGRFIPYGRILCVDDSRVYGYGRDPEYLSNSSVFEYRLFAAAKTFDPQAAKKLDHRAGCDWKKRAPLTEEQLTAVQYAWKQAHPPVAPRAMVLAGGTLFLAGPPDVVDEKAAWGKSNRPEVRKQLADQAAALRGEKGALLWAINAADGKKRTEYRLEAPPAWDAMAAAGGRLYLATMDGKVLCFEGK